MRDSSTDLIVTPHVTTPSVLIVDDQPANLLALEAILDGLPLATVRASSGPEALRQLLKRKFALILLDVQMPGMDGFETATAIKAHPSTAEVPIIFLTAIDREAAHVFKGFRLGAVDYIVKPFDAHILKAKVTTFVDLYTRGETIKAQANLLHKRELEDLERRKEERYRRLADLVPLVMWETGRDGSVRYVNRAWRDYSGLDADRTGTITNPQFVHPDDLPELELKWRIARERLGLFEMVVRLRRASDESYRWHLARSVPEQDARGVVDGWVVTATDIDEQKQLEAARQRFLEQEQEARRTAETANRVKDEFLANVSHELRGPLHAILGWSRMVRSGTLDPARVDRALETIERNANVQTALIEDLLDVSRIVSGKLRLRRERIELIEVVRAAVDTVRPVADQKGVTLELTTDGSSSQISADPTRLQQVVWNLVANAVKFTPKGGRVGVSVDGDESMVRVRVVDTGVGISPDFVNHAFDRFRQASGGSGSNDGLGLGLAIARHIVELHGGRIEAESDGLGRGATFRVSLPVELFESNEEEPEWFSEPSEKGAARSRSSLEGLSLLLVEHDLSARELFSALFRSCGAVVTAVGSADDALAELQSSKPLHALISNLVLSGEDGNSLIRRVRALAPGESQRIPALAVGAVARSEDCQRALSAGFQGCLIKPIEPSELVNLVRSLAQAARD